MRETNKVILEQNLQAEENIQALILKMMADTISQYVYFIANN